MKGGSVTRTGEGSSDYYIIENEGQMVLNCKVSGSAGSSLIRNNAAAATMTIVGGSSDHCIVDVEDCPRALQVGDIVRFDLCYSHMLYATSRNDVAVVYADA